MEIPEKANLRRRFASVIAVLVLASLACSLPGQRQAATPTAALPTRGTSAAPESSPEHAQMAEYDESLPPVLVETDPPAGSRIASAQPVTFYFSQPMDQPSVEGALGGNPAPSGSFEWLDEATLRFTPDQAYPADQPTAFTFATSARSAVGTAFQSEQHASFRVAGALYVTERLPKPGVIDANPSSAVVVTFGDPVVPLGAESSSLPAGFTLDPPAEGKGEWLNTSTYIFYPDPALKGGVTYSVAINAGLVSTLGGALDLSKLSPSEWSFTTSSPQLLSIDLGERDLVGLDQPIQITFNQPMDPVSVEQNLRLIAAGEFDAPIDLSWDDSGSILTVKPSELLRRGQNYTLTVGGFSTGMGGTPLGVDVTSDFTTVGNLFITRTTPPSGQPFQIWYGTGSVTIELSAPLDPKQDFSSLVSVQPPVEALEVNLVSYSGGGNSTLSLYGAFQPSTIYTVRLDPRLRDAWGGTLGAATEVVYTSSPAAPSLSIPAAQTGGPVIFVPAGESGLLARATNIYSVNLSIGRMDLAEFIHLIENRSDETMQALTPERQWTIQPRLVSDKNQELILPLRPDRDPLTTSGLYFYTATSPEVDSANAYNLPYLLAVSRYHLIVKRGSGEVLVWAINLNNQEPVANLSISIYDHTGRWVGQCSTDDQGVCRADAAPTENSYDAFYAVSGQPGDGDFAFASTTMSSGIASWQYQVPSGEPQPQDKIYIYTDRPIYRPGHEVFFRVAVRRQDDARYTPLDTDSIEIQINPPFDYRLTKQQPLTTMRIPLSDYGTASGSFSLPEGAHAGYYSITAPAYGYTGTVSFQVAEYKKPEFELVTAFEKTDILPNEGVHATVQASYYFGAPAGGLKVNWNLTRQTDSLYLPGGWQTGVYDTSWLNTYFIPGNFGMYITGGEGVTLPDGTLRIEVPAEAFENLDPQIRQRLTLEVTANDESNYTVSARAEAILHPATFYIGAHADSWGGQAGAELGFTLQTVDWANQPSGNHDLTAVFSKVTWTRKNPSAEFGDYTYEKSLEQVGDVTLRTDGLGRARIAFTPPSPGVYELAVSGEGALTSLIAWVGGAGDAPWPRLPNQRMRLETDQSLYQPGDTALVRFANPFAGRALALVTLERSRVHLTRVVEVNGPMAEVELPIEALDAPNVYAVVTLLGRDENNRLDFRHGMINLDVDTAALQLNVAVEPDRDRALPGEALGLTLRVKDSTGAPVQGEFSLALVDKAVLALADPNESGIFDTFYGRQPLGVLTGLDLASASTRILPQSAGRGGGGGDIGQPQIRSEFKDTVFWVGSLETGTDGTARVDLTLPDNLTTWVADVRGLDRDTRVGAARVEVVTSKDLLIRPVVPRFLTAGDHLKLGAIVQNNTAGSIPATVQIQAPGLSLDPATPAAQTVEVAAGGRVRVDWWVSVEDVAAVDPLFSVSGANLQDSTRLEGGPLAVLRYTSPQTFATAGVLSEAGEQLEVVNLPRTFTPLGAELRIELAPSLSAALLDGLQALETFPVDSTEQIISRLLSNLAAYRALNQLNLHAPELGSTLTREITRQVNRLLALQLDDGGFGWGPGDSVSQPYLSAYALLALNEARQQGFVTNPEASDRVLYYLFGQFITPNPQTETWELDRLAFLAFASATYFQIDDPSLHAAAEALYEHHELLSPWAQALLALTFDLIQPGDDRSAELVSILESSAARSATGASWDAPGPAWFNWSTPGFSTAVVTYSLARLDPATPLLTDAVRYLVLNRQPTGCWQSSYESAWVLFALGEALTATGDLQAEFTYEAELNGSLIASGSPSAPASALQPVQATASLSDLFSDGPNALRIRRSGGNGRLYYRAFLEVARPAEEAPPLERGLSVSRSYYLASQNCRVQPCQPVQTAALTGENTLLVRLTLTVPEDMYYVTVEDTVPAGVEIINPNLKTSTQVQIVKEGVETPDFDLRDPFGSENGLGYGWWYFSQARISDQGISWTASYLPAGTYQLSYRVVPVAAGEFRALPARAYQYYFPDIQGASAGNILVIE